MATSKLAGTSPARRQRAVPQPPDLHAAIALLEPLLEAGEATQGLRVDRSRGGLVFYRHWLDDPSAWPDDELDRRFRLTPLGGGQYDLSLWRRSRWERLPFQGTLRDLVDLTNTNSALVHWARNWPTL